MPMSATKAAPAYLREARIAAGFSSRDTAAIEIPFSPETIGRHERGDVPLTPDDALIYAQYYSRHDIAIRYCAGCPVGRATGKKANDRDLPYATLRLTQRLRKAAKEIADTLESIADDGIVDDRERPEFSTALSSLKELGETITDIVLYAASQGIEKGRPAKRQERPSTTTNILSHAAPSVNNQNQKGGANHE